MADSAQNAKNRAATPFGSMGGYRRSLRLDGEEEEEEEYKQAIFPVLAGILRTEVQKNPPKADSAENARNRAATPFVGMGGY